MKRLPPGSVKAFESIADKGIKVEGYMLRILLGEGMFRGKPTASYDLFRIENGKIAEHRM